MIAQLDLRTVIVVMVALLIAWFLVLALLIAAVTMLVEWMRKKWRARELKRYQGKVNSGAWPTRQVPKGLQITYNPVQWNPKTGMFEESLEFVPPTNEETWYRSDVSNGQGNGIISYNGKRLNG